MEFKVIETIINPEEIVVRILLCEQDISFDFITTKDNNYIRFKYKLPQLSTTEIKFINEQLDAIWKHCNTIYYNINKINAIKNSI